MKALEVALREVAREIAKKRVEHAVVLDWDGEEVWRGVGSRTRVGIPGDAAAGNVVVHNHPSGGSFSLMDLIFAHTCKVAEMVVVTRDEVFRLRPPFRGWPLGIIAPALSDPDAPSPTFTELARMAAATGCRLTRQPRIESEATYVITPDGTAMEAW